MRHITLVIVISVLSVLFLTGCQESDSSQIRRARLVANENLQLQENLKEKDQQIEELKSALEKPSQGSE